MYKNDKNSNLLVLFVLAALAAAVEPALGFDDFDRQYLDQRLRIAFVRTLRGDQGAEATIEGLCLEYGPLGFAPPPWACGDDPRGPGAVLKPDRFDSNRYDGLIREASSLYGLSPALVKAVIHVESFFSKDAVSPKGARGLMQLMPATARSLGVRNPFDPKENIFAGTRLLKDLVTKYGSLKKALIAYNAGPKWVGRPTVPKETRSYIRLVIRHYKSYKDSFGQG